MVGTCARGKSLVHKDTRRITPVKRWIVAVRRPEARSQPQVGAQLQLLTAMAAWSPWGVTPRQGRLQQPVVSP
jgi:hypothetical protein